ncbi:NADH:flavin oxidoreductase [Raoultibacter phocaeensis]|uniref:NADH:flavin oxidoreductase n=1 Tax=Raoultibacter phocaeensis TaxID=2479841 RepID=UPI00111954B0|nr:NADH:flavin oxidoreductase [Raoultibacter phocaeensis]
MNHLFGELSIGSLRAKNRFVRAATYEALATDDGHLTPELLAIYEALAEGGAGTIITGYAYVMADEHPNPNMMGIYDDSFVPEYRELVDAVHAHGTRIVLQIVYGGSGSKLDPPSKRILGPSALANPKTGIVPVEASLRDIEALVEAFAAAGRRACEAGFDGVELHAAHGYLLSQFLSPFFNRRTDAYGGSVENRARLAMEAVEAIRACVGSDFPIMVKINSSDGIDGGLTEAESLAAVRLLAGCGIDAVEVSGAWRSCRTKDFDGEPFFAEYAKRLADVVDIPIILTGGNRRFEAMERLAASGAVSGFGLCRPLICEPDLVRRWGADTQAIPRCVSCNGCDATYGHRCILPSA